jgi:hypothetical protein
MRYQVEGDALAARLRRVHAAGTPRRIGGHGGVKEERGQQRQAADEDQRSRA